MGLCREKVHREVEIIYPIDRCAEHKDTIRSCIYEEGAGKYTFMYSNYKNVAISDKNKLQ